MSHIPIEATSDPEEIEEEEEEVTLPELTTEQKIKHHAENVCAVEHIELHSQEASDFIDRHTTTGMYYPEIGLGHLSAAEVVRGNKVGSDLHAMFAGFHHAACIARFGDTFNTRYSISGEVHHVYDKVTETSKVSKIILPDVTLKEGALEKRFQWDNFNGAVPSYGYKTALFMISR
jgi:hypothetical protein